MSIQLLKKLTISFQPWEPFFTIYDVFTLITLVTIDGVILIACRKHFLASLTLPLFNNAFPPSSLAERKLQYKKS